MSKIVKVEILKSIGTVKGTLNVGSTTEIDEKTAKSWVKAKYAKIITPTENKDSSKSNDKDDTKEKSKQDKQDKVEESNKED